MKNNHLDDVERPPAVPESPRALAKRARDLEEKLERQNRQSHRADAARQPCYSRSLCAPIETVEFRALGI
jgi:hypothetical protein